jgi:transposase-like protein
VHAVVSGVSVEYASRGRTDAGMGGFVDRSTVKRWVITYSSPLEEAFHHRKQADGRDLYQG